MTCSACASERESRLRAERERDQLAEAGRELVKHNTRHFDAAVEAQTALATAERERDEARFRPMGDNHHNAASCPYCGDPLRAAQKRIEGLEAMIREHFFNERLGRARGCPREFFSPELSTPGGGGCSMACIRARQAFELPTPGAALSSPAVTEEGKKLGEEGGEA